MSPGKKKRTTTVNNFHKLHFHSHFTLRLLKFKVKVINFYLGEKLDFLGTRAERFC